MHYREWRAVLNCIIPQATSETTGYELGCRPYGSSTRIAPRSRWSRAWEPSTLWVSGALGFT